MNDSTIAFRAKEQLGLDYPHSEIGLARPDLAETFDDALSPLATGPVPGSGPFCQNPSSSCNDLPAGSVSRSGPSSPCHRPWRVNSSLTPSAIA